MLAAIFLPARANAFEAMSEASQRQALAGDFKLYTDGERLALLKNPLPGWIRWGGCTKEDA